MHKVVARIELQRVHTMRNIMPGTQPAGTNSVSSDMYFLETRNIQDLSVRDQMKGWRVCPVPPTGRRDTCGLPL